MYYLVLFLFLNSIIFLALQNRRYHMKSEMDHSFLINSLKREKNKARSQIAIRKQKLLTYDLQQYNLEESLFIQKNVHLNV